MIAADPDCFILQPGGDIHLNNKDVISRQAILYMMQRIKNDFSPRANLIELLREAYGERSVQDNDDGNGNINDKKYAKDPLVKAIKAARREGQEDNT
jgi:hypothetical protein